VSADYSLNALLAFLERAEEKGWLKKATASSRRIAAGKVLEVLDPSERNDLRTVDLDDAFQRFTNKNTGYNPRSLQEYKRRVNTAVRDFVAYTEDPASFKFTGSRAPKGSNGSKPKNQNRRGQEQPPEEPRVDEHEAAARTPDRPERISIPIPLRAGMTVHIQHLPHDLSKNEAERIAAIVRAYAMPE
jgi:hypothetical protein